MQHAFQAPSIRLCPPSQPPAQFQHPALPLTPQANAYEADGGQRIVVDSIHYDSLPAVGREALAEQQVGRGEGRGAWGDGGMAMCMRMECAGPAGVD